MPQMRVYTGKVIKTTVDLKEISKFLEINGFNHKGEMSINVNEIIRIRVYSCKIAIPPSNFEKCSLDVDLLNVEEPIVLNKIYVGDLVEFSSYGRGMQEDGYRILNNWNAGEIERIQYDAFKPIIPIRHYVLKARLKAKKIMLNPIAVTVIFGIAGIIATIVSC